MGNLGFFLLGGVVMGGVMDEMSKPAKMLPMARGVMGLDSVGSFSFIGVSVGTRVGPVWTSRVIRRL